MFNTRLDLGRGQVAQLVEQGIENPRVGSSILSLATIFEKGLPRVGLFIFVRTDNLMTCDSMPAGLVGRTLSLIIMPVFLRHSQLHVPMQCIPQKL